MKPFKAGCKNPLGEYMCELCMEHEIVEANEEASGDEDNGD